MTKTASLRRRAVLAAGTLLLAGAVCGQAQQFPTRPIRFVVPFPPGTASDILARLVGQRLGERLGQQVVIDNRSGASGTIGVETAARAAPDGHTLTLGTTSTHVLAPILNPKLGYDPVRDFQPVSLLGDAPYFLTTHAGLPVANAREFVAWARANPGKARYASVGNFSLAHLAGELLKKTAGIDMVHVPYKGSNLALIDLLAGRIELNVSTISASLPHVRAGKLRALAVTSLERNSILPEIPTIAESGFPGYQVSLWMGTFVPARTPVAVTALLDRETGALSQAGDFRAALAEQGFEPRAAAPGAFSRLIRDEAVRWRKVILEAGLKPGD